MCRRLLGKAYEDIEDPQGRIWTLKEKNTEKSHLQLAGRFQFKAAVEFSRAALSSVEQANETHCPKRNKLGLTTAV